MRKKQLETLNDELVLKVEKQKLLIEKLQKELEVERGTSKTVFIEKPIEKPSGLLERYADTCLFTRCAEVLPIFNYLGTEKPLEMISFEDWYKGLTRTNLINGAKHYNKEVFDYLDSMDLASLKGFFYSAAKNYYENEKEAYINYLNGTLTKAFKKKEKGE